MSIQTLPKIPLQETGLIFSLFIFVLNIVWPPGALLIALLILSVKPSLAQFNSVKLSTAIVLASMLATRAVPALPSDDLDDYIDIFKSINSIGLYEFLSVVRNEPIFYLPHFFFNFNYDDSRLVLFFISVVVAYLYLIAICNCFKLSKIPLGFYSMAIMLFPFEIASNIPRQIMAIFLFQSLVSTQRSRNFGVFILATLSHKTTFLVATLSLFPYNRLIIMLTMLSSFAVAVFGLDIILDNVSLDIFQRMRSYFVRDGDSGIFPFLMLVIVSLGVLFVAELRTSLWYYLPVAALAVAVASLGPLGIRLAYFAYIPCLVVCFALIERCSRRSLRREIVVLVGAIILFFSRILPAPNGDHDPLSGIGLMESFFLLPKLIL